MKFLKENSYDIIRLIINQVGITIFSLVIYFSVGSIDIESELLNNLIRIFISVFSMLFYYSLIYTISWDWGAKDKIRIDAGRMKPDKIKGLKMALVANVPNFILSLTCIISLGIYCLGAEWLNNFYGKVTLLNKLWLAIYQGIIHGVFSGFSQDPNQNIWLELTYLVIPAIAILVTHLGYTLGTKEKRIFGFLKRSKQS